MRKYIAIILVLIGFSSFGQNYLVQPAKWKFTNSQRFDSTVRFYNLPILTGDTVIGFNPYSKKIGLKIISFAGWSTSGNTFSNGNYLGTSNDRGFGIRTNGVQRAYFDTANHLSLYGARNDISFRIASTVAGSEFGYNAGGTLVERYTNGSNADEYIARKARGTTTSPLNVQDGDQLGGILFGGYTNSGFQNSCVIRGKVSSTVGSLVLAPSDIWFKTTDGTYNPEIATTSSMVIKYNQYVGINTDNPAYGLTVNRSFGVNRDSLPTATNADSVVMVGSTGQFKKRPSSSFGSSYTAGRGTTISGSNAIGLDTTKSYNWTASQGIGTSPSYKLDVLSGTTGTETIASFKNGTGGLKVGTVSGGYSGLFDASITTPSFTNYYLLGASDLNLNCTGSSSIYFNNNGNTIGRWNTTGLAIGDYPATPRGKLTVPADPTASSNYGLASFGNGAFDGSTSGYFTGSANGTVDAINITGSADFANWQKSGVSKFKVDNDGNTTTTSVRGTAVTFANRPSTPVEGMMLGITDSTTDTWGATITGGGSLHVLAYYNGTNWTVFGK